MEIRVAVTRYVSDRIAASRQQQSRLPLESPDKLKGGYENVAVIRANSMKHMPNFFEKGQVGVMDEISAKCKADKKLGIS
jgi:tRNA (guanine-N7-)-methyltransferase